MTPNLPNLDADSGDLEFLLGVIFNQRIRSDVAWRAPGMLRERLGSLDPEELAAADPEEFGAVLRQRPALHPFSRVMARNVIGACKVLMRDYHGQACRLWDDQPSTMTLLSRFTSFPGIGHHKATVAIALLAQEYDIPIDSDGISLIAEALASCPRLGEALGDNPSGKRPAR